MEKDHLPQLAGSALPNAAQNTIGLLCCKGAPLVYVQLVHHEKNRAHLNRMCFGLGIPQQIQKSHQSLPLMPFLLFSAIAGRSSLEDVKLLENPECKRAIFSIQIKRGTLPMPRELKKKKKNYLQPPPQADNKPTSCQDYLQSNRRVK